MGRLLLAFAGHSLHNHKVTPRELEKTIRSLLAEPMADTVLRERLEKLAQDEKSFSGFTWLFGPELYRRNRILFRPFILSRFSTWMVLKNWSTEAIKWKGEKGAILERWLGEVDKNDDADLFRRLYDWKLDLLSSSKRAETIAKDLVVRFKAAQSRPSRQIVLKKFELWFELNQETAVQLYTADPLSAGPFILQRLPSQWLYAESKRTLWNQLISAADERNDQDFAWKLYRKQVSTDQWLREALAVCESVQDPILLVQELEKRHPEGWSVNVTDGFLLLLQRRGRDLFPYLMRHLQQVRTGWLSRGNYGKMADFAKAQGWWDLWAALVRICSSQREFNNEVKALLEEMLLNEGEIKKRLMMLAGVSREWNMPGFGVATVHQLDESVALKFDERFPEILRGPYRLHLQGHSWGNTYPKLLNHFLQKNDEEMIDLLASRLVTRYGSWGNASKMLAEAEQLEAYYSRLKGNEALFCRRAANVLGQVPAYSIYGYDQLIRENKLARLLFERSAASYLADPKSLADLVEASEIHVMALAYRALSLNDPRAREQAVTHLPLLMGTLLRPMQRATRMFAFNALANAANTEEHARLILERCKDAMNLPDTRYPKEKLLGLIAQVLHRWPQLRSNREQPVVYERAAA